MSASTTTTPKPKSNPLKGITNSVKKTLKKWGLYKSKESSKDKLVREIQELPDAPTTDVRATIRERNSFLEQVQRDLHKDIEKQEQRKQQLQKIARQIGTLKKRDKRRLSSMEKQEEIMKTLKKTGFSINADAKTLEALKKAPSAPRNTPSKQNRTYKVPENSVQISEIDMEREIGNEPVAYLSYNQIYRKGGRRTHKKRPKKCKN